MSKLKNKIIKATKTGGIYKLYYKSYFKNKNQVSHTTIHNIVTFKSLGLNDNWTISLDIINDIVYDRDDIIRI